MLADKDVEQGTRVLLTQAIASMQNYLSFWQGQGIKMGDISKSYSELSENPNAGMAECLIWQATKRSLGYWPGMEKEERDRLGELSYTIYKLCYQLQMGTLMPEHERIDKRR